MKEETICFNASLYQAKTDSAGGWRIIFDVPETDATEILKLSKLINQNIQLVVVKLKEDF